MNRMKFLFLMLLWVPMTIWANTKQMYQRVRMSAQYEKNKGANEPTHRAPAAPICFAQNEHVLLFDEKYAGDIVSVNEGNFVLYANIIDSQGCFEIPASITGIVEVQLLRGNLTYRAIIEL